MRDQYIAKVSLLISVLPSIIEESVFALKGGTAINLFHRDMPRLSVDIDLTYLPVSDRSESLTEIDETFERIVNSICLSNPELTCQRTKPNREVATRILVRNQAIEIKIETSPVARGTVYPSVRMVVSPTVMERFGYAEANIAVFEELFAGKIVAALDRQHPRDLFDVKLLYDHEGLTDKLFRMFLVYLAGSRKPVHEILAPKKRLEDSEVLSHFEGMTAEPVAKETLIEAQDRLHEDIRGRLTGDVASFLLSLHDAEPDFDAIGVPAANDLPAIKWKLLNLARLKVENPQKHSKQREALRALFR